MRARLSVMSTVLLAGLVLGGLSATAEAQFGKRLKDAVKRTAEDKAIQKATETESKAIDGALEAPSGRAPPGSESARRPSSPLSCPRRCPSGSP